ncbi:MAG: methyl-accepting chemotaxis protein, partial [Selenomonas sp.]|nr:methyl-accepting chemotaxis protein [Selenomonas sp.]
MNLKNIPIGSKILSLVIVALLGMAFIGFNGYRGLSNASDDIDNMYSRKLQATKLLGNEINYMRMVQVRIAKHVLDPKDAKAKASIHDAMDSFEKEWPAYRDLGARVPETANDIAQAETNWKKFKEGVLEAERLADKGETQAAWNYYQGVEAGVTQDLLKNLTALQKIANDNADKLNEEVSSSMSSNLWFMTVVTLVCLTLLGLMSFFIIREIITSIRQMIDNCRNMGEGDFRHKPLLGRGDELGEMDAALHEMRTKMNKLMREVHDSAQQLAAASEELTASSGQAAQVSTQVAQSATDVVGSVEKQERSVANTNNAVESLQASMEGIRQESAR